MDWSKFILDAAVSHQRVYQTGMGLPDDDFDYADHDEEASDYASRHCPNKGKHPADPEWDNCTCDNCREIEGE